MTLPKLIEKHRLNAAYLAECLNLTRGAFNNKLKGNNGNKFTPKEQVALLKVLAEMQKDIRDYISHVE